MKTKILSFFLVLAPAVPALFLLSACRPEPSVEPVVGFSINVPDWFDLGNGEFKEDGGRVEQPYGLWSGGFDEFKTAITGTKHYESGGSNTIDNDELTITCSGSGYRTMEANEDEGYTVTVAWEDYSIRFTLIVNRAFIDVTSAQLDSISFAYDGEVKSPKLVNIWMGFSESAGFHSDVPEGVIAYSGNENAEVGKYTLRAVIHNKNYRIWDGKNYLDRWEQSFEWEIVQPSG